MGLVLWIDQNTFATSLLERVYKKRNLPFYTIENGNDFLYLVEDLKPELLVLDSKTAHDSRVALEKQYVDSETLRKLPVIVIDEMEELPFLENKIGTLKRPFDPFKIPEVIGQIFKAN